MDPLTHAALGAAAAAAVADDDELRPAALIGALTAVLPDLDVLVDRASDPLLALEVHRAYTHALPVVPLVALIGALLTVKVGALTFRRRWTLAAVAALTHPLLDVCTSYGVRLLWPLAGHWMSLGVVAVVDPVPTLALLVLLGLALRRRAPHLAGAALFVVLGYLALGSVQHLRARAAISTAMAERGLRPDTLVVKPTLGNLLLWRGLARVHGEMVYADAVWVGHRTRVTAGDSAWIVRPETGDAARFARLTRGWTIEHPDAADVLGDARYAMLPTELRPLWGVEITPDGTRWRTFRRTDPATRRRFLDLLLGR